MRRCSTRSLLWPSIALAAVLAGCVTRGSYDDVAAERDLLRDRTAKLETQVQRLEAANTSFRGERVDLINRLEDLRQAQAALEADLHSLKRSKAALGEHLAAREAELGKLRGTYDGLVADLEAEVASGQIQIEQLREGLRLNLAQEILFPSGSAQLNAGGVAVLRKVAQRLKTLPNRVEVQGHTDNVALLPSARYPSNWELAAARSGEVVRLFVASGIQPERLEVVSFGEYAPIASNDTPEGRAKNRRIEIRLHPVGETAPAATDSTGPS